MRLNEDNAYPVQLYAPSKEDPKTTLVFTQEEMDEKIRNGWKTNYEYREYPKHVATGEMREIRSEFDGGITERPVTVVVHSKAEEEALLKSVAPAVEKPRLGRPPKVQQEEPVVA